MTRALTVATLTTLLSACAAPALKPQATSATQRSPQGGGESVARSAPLAEAEAPPVAGAAPSAADASAPGTSDVFVERRAESRPGLGTAWGETRSSHVTSAPFERDNPASPFVTVAIYYNDAEGVRAMTRGGSLAMPAQSGVEIAGGALSVRLLDAAGRPLPTYDFGSRRYVVGSDGERYVMQLRNNTGHRIEAVATVDGLDVIDGRPGSLEKRGYLLRPWATVEIDGFRQNMSEVAAFRFGAVSASYAAKKGDDRNVGVIGVAFFNERNDGVPLLDPEIERRNAADPFPGRFATPPTR